MRRSLKWTAAILASGVLHAGAAAWMLQSAPDEALIEGSATMEIALLGSIEDAISAGQDIEPDVADPVREHAEPVEPRPTEQPPSAEAVVAKPVEAAPAPVVEAIEPDEALPAQVNLPADAVVPDELAKPVEVAAATTVQPGRIEPEAAGSPEQPERARAVETALAVVPPVAEAIEPDEPVDTIEAVEDIPLPPEVPLPTARPEAPVIREAIVRPKADAPRAQRQPERQRPAGSGGKQVRDSRKGQADGSESGGGSVSGAGRGGGQAGNAAVSNYPGQVASKLRRAVRTVPRSARSGALRDVHVAFVVTSDGGLGSVRISQSSGSAELDQAALDSVRRAAPFPPIPAGAGRSSWSFSVPLGLAR